MSNLNIGGTNNVGDDPLALAALYRAGLNLKWQNQTDAARQLTSVGLRVRRAQIQQALAVSAFPREILALFSHVGIVHETARLLVRARNEKGVAELVRRAGLIDPAGKSRTEILAHLSGTDRAIDFRDTYKKDSPLALYGRYVEGLRLNTWTTMREASEVMGIAHSRLVSAAAVAELPGDLTSVLPATCLTFEMGRALADLIAVRGVEAVRKEALAVKRLGRQLSPQGLLARLMGLDDSQFLAKVRRAPERNGRPGGIFVELHLNASDVDNKSRLETLVACLNVEFGKRLATANNATSDADSIVVPREDPLRPYLAEQTQRLNRPIHLSRLSAPPHLSGATGSNRSAGKSPLGVHDDRSALEHWLSAYENPATKSRYQNEVERLMLWAIIAKGKPLSSIDVADANEYINKFAVDPRPRSVWVMKGQGSRDVPTWRPFRGPLSDESRRKALETLRKCFADLVSLEYLVANPFQTVKVVSVSKSSEK